MSHFTGGFIVAGVMLAVGLAIAIFSRRKDARGGEVFAAVGFLVLGAVELAITWTALKASKNAVGEVQSAKLVDTADGPRVVTIDVIEHTDILALLSRQGGALTWKESRLNVFDLVSGSRLLRMSFEGQKTSMPTLVGDVGGYIGVMQPGMHYALRLLRPSDGADAGDLDILASKIQDANALKHVTSVTFDDASGCLLVRADATEMHVSPRDLQPTEKHCSADAGTGDDQVTFAPRASLSVKHVDAHFKNPRFARDSRTAKPMFVGDPRAAVLLNGENELFATALSPAGAVVWSATLPAGLFDLTLRKDELIACSATKVIVIDAATGKTAHELSL